MNLGRFLFVFIDIKQRNTPNWNSQQHGDIVIGNIALELFAELHNAIKNGSIDRCHAFTLFDIFVNTVFDKYLRQSFPVNFIQQPF